MNDFLTNELFLYLSLICIIVAFRYYSKARKRRKEELEQRGSLRKTLFRKRSREAARQ